MDPRQLLAALTQKVAQLEAGLTSVVSEINKMDDEFKRTLANLAGRQSGLDPRILKLLQAHEQALKHHASAISQIAAAIGGKVEDGDDGEPVDAEFVEMTDGKVYPAAFFQDETSSEEDEAP